MLSAVAVAEHAGPPPPLAALCATSESPVSSVHVSWPAALGHAPRTAARYLTSVAHAVLLRKSVPYLVTQLSCDSYAVVVGVVVRLVVALEVAVVEGVLEGVDVGVVDKVVLRVEDGEDVADVVRLVVAVVVCENVAVVVCEKVAVVVVVSVVVRVVVAEKVPVLVALDVWVVVVVGLVVGVEEGVVERDVVRVVVRLDVGVVTSQFWNAPARKAAVIVLRALLVASQVLASNRYLPNAQPMGSVGAVAGPSNSLSA